MEDGRTCTCFLDNWWNEQWDSWDFNAGPQADCESVSTTTTTTTTTTPTPSPWCRLDNGSLVEGLEPGGSSVLKGCLICSCDPGGRASCYREAYCDVVRCVDPQMGECCTLYPNGKPR